MSRLADEFFGTELFLHVVLTGAILGISAYLIGVRFSFCIQGGPVLSVNNSPFDS